MYSKTQKIISIHAGEHIHSANLLTNLKLPNRVNRWEDEPAGVLQLWLNRHEGYKNDEARSCTQPVRLTLARCGHLKGNRIGALAFGDLMDRSFKAVVHQYEFVYKRIIAGTRTADMRRWRAIVEVVRHSGGEDVAVDWKAFIIH